MTWIFSAPQLDEVELFVAAQRLVPGRLPGFMSAAELRAVTIAHGVDLATALAERVIRSDPTNARFLARCAGCPEVADAGLARGVPLALIPTMYHRERPELGGDGRLVAEIAQRLGFVPQQLAVDSLGTISGNADQLIAQLATWTRPRWVVSISKGTADLKQALIRRPDLAERVAGWISLAGMPGGTPLAGGRGGGPLSRAMIEGWLRLRGARSGMLAEMSDTHPFSLTPAVLPPSGAVINVVPLPLACHLRKPVDRSYASLAVDGPNDGYVPLAASVLPGAIVPLWGADHYLRVPELVTTLYRLLRLAAGGG
jgi:hypothetical protein